MRLSTTSCWMLASAITASPRLSCWAEQEKHGECSRSADDDDGAREQTCSSSIPPTTYDSTTSDAADDESLSKRHRNRILVKNHRPSRPNTLPCDVYMAPSTLGEETNMGIYTGRNMKVDDVVNYPEVAIPLLFREWGEHPEGYSDGSLWERYVWEGEIMDIESYVDTRREMSRAVFVPGVGCTINAVMDMNNIESTHGSKYDTAGLHRKKDPGVGSFTPYHASETTITHAIRAGAELFASYGAEWIPAIPGAQVTLDPDLDKAVDFLRDEYWPFVQLHRLLLSETLKQALWEFTTIDFPVTSPSMTNLPRAQPWSSVEEAIVEHEQKQQQRQASTATDSVDKQSTPNKETEKEDEDVVRQFIRKQSIRSLDWLHDNGYCQDHIVPGRSTIVQAGRGAFAARDLPRDTIVGYSPLIHMGTDGREILDIVYDNDDDNDDERKDEVDDAEQRRRPEKGRHQYDLILNYCFGHANSSLLLTPYGGMVNYINHDSRNPNIRIKWPDYELVAHKPDWLEKDVYFLRDTLSKIGLSFEYVATREIEKGEELFMDYGKEWEDAWSEHVANWEPLEDAHEYIHSSEWKEDYFRTHEELTELGNPYPPNLHTMCIESFSADDDGKFYFIPILRETMKRVYCDVVNRRKQPKKKKASETDGVGADTDAPVDEFEYIYDVDLRLDMDDDDSWVQVVNYTSDAIFLYDRAFATDWHMPNVFRHEIMIPDEIMPKSWQNGPPKHRFR